MGSARKKRREEARILNQREKKKKSREIQHERRLNKNKMKVGKQQLGLKAMFKHIATEFNKRENRDATVIYMPSEIYDFAIMWIENGIFNETIKLVKWDLELHKDIIDENCVDVNSDLVAD